MKPREAFVATLAVLAALATGYVLFMSVRIVIILLVAIILASAARPLIMKLNKWGMPEVAATLLIFGGIILATLIMAVAVLAPIVNQFANYLEQDWRLANRIIVANHWFANNFSNLTGQQVAPVDAESIREAVSNLLEGLRTTAPELLDDISNIIGESILTVVMGIYWLTSRHAAVSFIVRLVPYEHREKLETSLLSIEETLGAYTRGIVFVALVVGLLNLIVLVLLGIPNAGTYAFIIGITTILPVVGGLVGGGLATALALLGSPLDGLAVFLVFLVVQQIESYVLSPRVMSNTIGLDPLLVLVGIFVGFALYGVIGALIALPVMAIIDVLLREFVVAPREPSISSYSLEDGMPIFKAKEPVVQVPSNS